VKIRVRVRPSSRTDEVVREGECLVVRVKEPPKEGRANRALTKLLAEYFGVSQTRVSILSGLRSKDKVVEIADQ
jgi:uncharacterized protein